MSDLDETPEDEVTQDDSLDEAPDDKAGEKVFSQTDLDKLISKRLKRQEDQLLRKYADYDKRVEESESFRKLQDEKATDAQRWEKERAQLQASLQERDTELTKLQRASLIADLATDKGLPKSFWKRVQGDTEEEIAEDMDSIIKDLGLGKDSTQDKDTSGAKKRRSIYGGGGESPDPEPDTDAIVKSIPRGAQIRVDKPRSHK